MHDLNNVTVGAALKALPILHPHVQLSPVGVCAGWNNASYQEHLVQEQVITATTESQAVSQEKEKSTSNGSSSLYPTTTFMFAILLCLLYIK